MTRKEELQVLIVHTKESINKMNVAVKQKLEGIKGQFVDLLVNGLNFDRKHIHRISIDGSRYVHIEVVNPEAKTDSRKTAGNLTLYLKDYNDDEMSMGWFSSGASKSNAVNLIYLELCGIIAKDIRTDGHIDEFFETALVEVRELQASIRRTEAQLYTLNRELSNIIYDEVCEKILNNGGLTFNEPKLIYINNKDRSKTFVDSVVIEDATQKTLTLSYRCDGTEVRKVQRVKLKDAMYSLQVLYREHCMSEEEIQESQYYSV